MDKSSGDQLNRAYDAYRQACMEKERFRKELLQKTEFYEQQSREQHKQIASLKQRILLLTSQLSSFAGADNNDVWKNESAPFNLPLEELENQLRASLQREKHYGDQLEMQKLQVLEMEDGLSRLKSTLSSKNEEIQLLKSLLKEAKERQEKLESRTIHGREEEMRNKNVIPELSVAASGLIESEKQSVERIFSDIKEEFSRICKLTREQRSQLNTFLVKKGPASEPLEQFSMPVQCTDEENQEAKLLPKPNMGMASSFTPITARGLAPELDLSISVESLSNLSVKFPPSNDESEFLKSSTESPPILPQGLEQKSKIHAESPPFLRKFSTARSSPPYSPRSPKTLGHIDNGKLTELGSDYKDPCVVESEDSTLFPVNNSGGKCLDVFLIPDNSDVSDSMEVTGRTVRGPQQPIWKPSSHQDNDPSLSVGEKWDGDSSDICEFCQAVFPPYTRAAEEFFRHLNSHFLGQS